MDDVDESFYDGIVNDDLADTNDINTDIIRTVNGHTYLRVKPTLKYYINRSHTLPYHFSTLTLNPSRKKNFENISLGMPQ